MKRHRLNFHCPSSSEIFNSTLFSSRKNEFTPQKQSEPFSTFSQHHVVFFKMQKKVRTRGFSVAMFPSMLTISNSGVYLCSIVKGQQQTKNIIYHNVRFFYYITIATKSKRNQNFVHAKRHTTVKYQISFNQLAVTVHKKVTLADKKRRHTNKFVSPLTESLMCQRSHLVPSQVPELRYVLGANVNTPFFNYPHQKHCTRALKWAT